MDFATLFPRFITYLNFNTTINAYNSGIYAHQTNVFEHFVGHLLTESPIFALLQFPFKRN